ncbi:hypothetical protein NA56DRAFT_718313 [Hyaloscypha hepaticicola]|uniref:2EXR domain-containing protein n=1 Tax=Hyaloscypha hepaticicola TaxID=2082293 RepID=A0A2J6Q869_9HELO|nr:hypothetical protein NA56DRAFT_718313 [Hyaloscypha hepaticicola]
MASSAPSTSTSAASSSAPAPLVAFTTFPNLPQELQDEIWKQALPGSRLITIANRLPAVMAAFSISIATPNIHLMRNRLRALCRPPILLQVSVASRNVALQHYQPMFQHVLSAPVFVDPEMDILHFYNHQALAWFDQVAAATHSNVVELPLIRAVAIPHMHLTTTPRNSLACTMDVIKVWHRTRDIYMVSPTMNGPINGFGVDEMKMWLTLHRRLVLDEMTEREKGEWEAPSVFFLREEDLETMFG